MVGKEKKNERKVEVNNTNNKKNRERVILSTRALLLDGDIDELYTT